MDKLSCPWCLKPMAKHKSITPGTGLYSFILLCNNEACEISPSSKTFHNITEDRINEICLEWGEVNE